MLLEAVAQARHHEAGLVVVEVGPLGAVLAAEHEHLVDAAGRRLGEHRAEVAAPSSARSPRRRGSGWARSGLPLAVRRRRSRARAASPPRCPGRTGRADRGRSRPPGGRGLKSSGRVVRSVAIVTQRPVSGLRRSWLTGSGRNVCDHALMLRAARPRIGTRAGARPGRTASVASRTTGRRAPARRRRPSRRAARGGVADEAGSEPVALGVSSMNELQACWRSGSWRSTNSRTAVDVHLAHLDRRAPGRRGPARTPRARGSRPGASTRRRSAPRQRRWSSSVVRLKKVLNAAMRPGDQGPSGSGPAMSPRWVVTRSAAGLGRPAGRASPATRRRRAPRRRADASGTASRPVPTPSSSTGPRPASATSGRRASVSSPASSVRTSAVPVVVHVGEAVAVGRATRSLSRPPSLAARPVAA